MTPLAYLTIVLGGIAGAGWFGGFAASLCAIVAVGTMVLWGDDR